MIYFDQAGIRAEIPDKINPANKLKKTKEILDFMACYLKGNFQLDFFKFNFAEKKRNQARLLLRIGRNANNINTINGINKIINHQQEL